MVGTNSIGDMLLSYGGCALPLYYPPNLLMQCKTPGKQKVNMCLLAAGLGLFFCSSFSFANLV